MSHFKFFDVSGVGNAGKGALVDFLRELDGFWVPEHSFEFDLFRSPGGILDLHHHLVEDWSLIRSDRAIKDFDRVTLRMGLNPSGPDLVGRMLATGQRLDRRFQGDFLPAIREFREKLVAGTFLAYWPYDSLSWSPLKVGLKKALYKLGVSDAIRSPVHLTKSVDFQREVTQLINRLYRSFVPIGTSRVVFNNAFEPFNPVIGLNLLQNSKIFIIYRDPRDVFASGQSRGKVRASDKVLQAKDNDGRTKSFLGTDNLEMFIIRYRTFMERMYQGNDKRVLRLAFEDFVLNHEQIKPRIFDFIEGEPTLHRHPLKYFDPEKSKRNIGIWKMYSDQMAIRRIEEELPSFLWKD
jgi:hypothetical protein